MVTIPIPPDLARGRVTWTVGRTDGTTLPGARGTVRFEATAVAVTYSTATVLPSPVEPPVVDGIMTPVDLLVNDPEVWNWRVAPRLGVTWEPFHIDVDGPVDLATAAVVPGGGPIRAVKGEKGDSGASTIDQVTGLQAALNGKARKEPVDLGEQNLDDVIDEGPYVQTSSATATAARNYPANGNGLYTAGFLDVVSRPGDYLVKQYFTAFNGLDTMWRTRYAGTWNQWRRTFRADEATPVINRVTALEYNTGWRDVTSLLGTQYISGEYWIKRVRNTVYLHFYELKLVAGTGTSVRPSWPLITGFRPSTRYANMPFAGKNTTQYAAGPVRVSRYGVTDIYGYAADRMIDADVLFDTEDAQLATSALPGAAVTIF